MKILPELTSFDILQTHYHNLPPSNRFDMFDTLVRPVLTYGSDVWGMSKSGQGAL